jgi:hypothetical protein
MSATVVPDLISMRIIQIDWENGLLGVIAFGGSGFADDSDWSVGTSAQSLINTVISASAPTSETITPNVYTLPVTFSLQGLALEPGAVYVASVTGDGIHIPAFNGISAGPANSGFRSALGAANYITFYEKDGAVYYSINPTLTTAYTLQDTVQYASWAGFIVFDTDEVEELYATFSDNWADCDLMLFDKAYFKTITPTSVTVDGVASTTFPVTPKNPPADYPGAGAWGVARITDARFHCSVTLSGSPLHVKTSSEQYELSTEAFTPMIWPVGETYDVVSCRVGTDTTGGTLYAYSEDNTATLGAWQDITGQPQPLGSLGTPSSIPFIWPDWDG